MAYSRFTNSDIYIYPSTLGHIECSGCFLNIPTDEYSLFQSTQIHDDETLLMHILQHKLSGHNMPENLAQEILADPDRYSKYIP
jgi:hypothetical protein